MRAFPVVATIAVLVFAALGCSESDDSGASPAGFNSGDLADCPTATADPIPKIDADFESAWAAADPAYIVTLLVSLTAQPTIEEWLGTGEEPTAIQQAEFEAFVRDDLQACTVAYAEALGATVLNQFAATGNDLLVEANREQGLALIGYSEVAEASGVGASPPEAGATPCVELGEVECPERPDCELILGQVYNEDGNCTTEPVPVGCTQSDLSGGDEPRWAQTPGGECVYFPNNLVPLGWTNPAEGCPADSASDLGECVTE